MSKFITQTRKTGALGADMAQSDTSATLATATFGSPVGKQIITIDGGNANAADFLCTIVGTAVSSMTLLNGSDVAHASGAAVTMNAVDEHFNLIYNALDDGWVDPLETPTKGTGSTLVFAGVDRTSTYAVGDKIKLTDSTVKYFYITAVAFSTDTTLTVTGGSDYTLAAHPTAGTFYYSKSSSPVEFPQWFNATAPTFDVSFYDNGSGGQPTTTKSRFTISGRNFFYWYKGSGVKAGSNSFLVISALNTIVPSDVSSIIGIGNSYTTSGDVNRVSGVACSSPGALVIIAPASITDNVVLDTVSFTLNYEI